MWMVGRQQIQNHAYKTQLRPLRNSFKKGPEAQYQNQNNRFS